MSQNFDRDVEELASSLKRLPKNRVAVVFNSSAQRLHPLYAKFCSSNQWDPSSELGTVLDTLWRGHLEGGLLRTELFARILNLTPDAEYYDNLEATLALDFCICLDSVARCLVPSEKIDYEVIDANLEAVRIPLCFKLTGLLDFPDDEHFSAIIAEVRSDLRYLEEIRRINEDILTVSVPELSQSVITTVKSRALTNALTPQYLGY